MGSCFFIVKVSNEVIQDLTALVSLLNLTGY